MRSGTTSKLVDGEPLPGPPEAGHHLVGDEHDAVAVADLPYTGHVSGRRHHDARGAGTDSRMIAAIVDAPSCAIRRSQVLQRPLRLLLLVLGVETSGTGRAVEVHRPRAAGSRWGTARVTGEVDGRVGTAVSSGSGEHLTTTGVQPGHPHGVLDPRPAPPLVRTPVRSPGVLLGDQARGLRAGGRWRAGARWCTAWPPARRWPRRPSMLMADVGEHQLAEKSSSLVPSPSQTVGALGGDDRHRLDLRLRRPGVEDVLRSSS